jgi:plasmid stabilization system protein ParE
LSALASDDLRFGLERYEGVAGGALSDAFALAVDTVLERLSRFPESGSPQFADRLNVPNLRGARLARFDRWIVYHFNMLDHILVARILESNLDITAEFFITE